MSMDTRKTQIEVELDIYTCPRCKCRELGRCAGLRRAAGQLHWEADTSPPEKWGYFSSAESGAVWTCPPCTAEVARFIWRAPQAVTVTLGGR